MTVENTNGDARPAGESTQQTSVGADEGISALEQMVVDGEAPATEKDNAQEETPETEAKPETESDDESAEADGEDEETEESEEADEEDEPESEHAHKGARAEKRIHKLTAQRNEVREKLAVVEGELTAAKAVVESNIPLPADRLTPEQYRAIRQANDLEVREEFLLSHVGVGYEDDNDPSKSLTAKQVAEELVQVRRAQSHVGDARRMYEEAKRQFLEDAKAGKLLRLSKQALNKTKKPAPVVKSSSSPSATAARSAASSQIQRRGMSVDRFRKSGGSEDAAIRELEELVPA
jgi:hypothetical protein